MKTSAPVFASLVCLSLLLRSAHAGDGSQVYWVDDDGVVTTWADCESQSALDGAAACTLAVANANAGPGDTVNLRAGTYTDQVIEPQSSGTSDGDRITYAGHDGEEVVIAGSSRGILIDGQAYISVSGVRVQDTDGFMYIYSGHHNVVGHCTFDRGNYGDWAAARISRGSQYNRVHHCSFTRWAGEAWDAHRGGLFDIGNNFQTDDQSFYNLVEDNVFAYGGHHILGVYANYNVVRNNYLHNESWDWEGYRGAITEGPAAGRCLYEGNRFAYAFEASGFALRSERNIVRRNFFYHNGNGGIQIVKLADSARADHNRIYHNVFFHNGHAADYSGFAGGIILADWGEGDPTGNLIANNIFYDNANGSVSTDAVSDPQVVFGNWDDNTTDPGFADPTGTDPADPSRPDFHLMPDSAAEDAGAWLTTIDDADGTGTTFRVADAGCFMDGWGVIEGDTIQLAGQPLAARITHVDYDTGVVTLDTSLTYTTGQGVGLAYRGAAPDQGAHELSDDDLAPAPPDNLQVD